MLSTCLIVQLPENDELTWDDGSAFPEPCLDNVAPMVGGSKLSVSLTNVQLDARSNEVNSSCQYFGTGFVSCICSRA